MAKHHSSVEIPRLVEKARAHLPSTEHEKPAKLTDEIMSLFRNEFRRLPSDFYRWCREGLYQRLCARFKEHGTDHSVSRQYILGLWKDPIAREHVIRFGDTGFYNPDARRYVDLTPERTPAQIRAGGLHKLKFGDETIKQGRALIALADYLDKRRH
jgi:hypothetical protein